MRRPEPACVIEQQTNAGAMGEAVPDKEHGAIMVAGMAANPFGACQGWAVI